MPDYAACSKIRCPNHATCGRFLMVWGPRQSIGDFDPEKCDVYWDTRTKRVPWYLQDLVSAEVVVLQNHFKDKGDVYCEADFMQAVQSGAFIDYDGYGQYIDVNEMGSRIEFRHPSDFVLNGWDSKYKYVLWFNR